MFSCFHSATRRVAPFSRGGFNKRCIHVPKTFNPTASQRSRHSRFYSSKLPNFGGKEKNTLGVFTPLSAALFVVTGVSLYLYLRHEKAQLLEQRQKERESRKYGKPQIGGSFALTRYTHTGDPVPFTELDMLGKWNLVYFGFTNCPDICPAELDKVTSVLNNLIQAHGPLFQPIFISVDPARDTPSSMSDYLSDFHPTFVGLVGSYQATKDICKKYRVYFSTPPDADPKGDYLVDHSIFVYLMDPEGQFCEAFGQNVENDEMIEKIEKAIVEYDEEKSQNVM